MNIAYITQTLPFPLDIGGNIIAYSTLTALKRLGHNITIFSFVNEKKKLQYEKNLMAKGFKIGKTIVNPFLIQSNNQDLLNKFISYCLKQFSLKPYTISKFYNKELATAINDHLKKRKIDCLWINCLSMSQYLPKTYKGLKILELIDIESEFYKRMFLKDSFLHWRIYAFFEWIKFYIFEKIQFNKFDKIFTVSKYDKSLIQNRVKTNVLVLSPVIKIRKITKIRDTEKNLLFVGNLCWYPNKDGIYWFLKKVYPDSKKKFPDLKLNIVGKMPRRNIFPVPDGVYFHGYKENIKSFFRNANIFIVPIRYGSGIRIKILEAMSWGLPVVSTYEGAEGLEVKNEREIILGENEEDFENKIFLLLRDRNLQIELIKNACLFLKEKYSYKNLNKILNNTLGGS